MKLEEVIAQLDSLIENSQSFHQEDNDVWQKDIEALEVAKTAVGKLIPKAVRIEGIANVKALDAEDNKIYTYKCIRCPSCSKWIVVNVGHKYCEYCGQKIDWSEIGGDEE